MRFFSKKIGAGILFFLCLFLISINNLQAQAPSVTKLYGSAWSDNIGWISLNNCKVSQSGAITCSGLPYNVEVGDVSGEIVGAAWSDNIGWIKFGGLSDFPSGAGTISENAKVDFTTGKVTGWARACAGTLQGDCSTMESRTDGFDGWISLSGALHPSGDLVGNGGVTFNEEADRLVGVAWGGPVVGWVDFFDVRYGPIPPTIVPVEYNLTNSTQISNLQIQQGAIGHPSVTREWVADGPNDIILSAPGSINNGKINISIDSNNPCLEPLGPEDPECVNPITIDVDQTATLGQHSFIVSGNPESAGAGVDQTTINFEVIEPEPMPEFICEAEGNPWLYETITWTVESDEFAGNEEFYWRHSEEDVSTCNVPPSDECQISYKSVGTKVAEISLNGPSGPYTDCEPLNIGAQVFFKQI